MNKIYKVIWSKARNCYVAVSEIANAHSKGGKRARAAALSALLISAVLAPFSMPTLEAAYTASGTDDAQYTVFQATEKNPASTKTITYNNKTYTYNLQALTNPDDKSTVNVYVRDGYTAALVTGKRYTTSGDDPVTGYKIMAYKTGTGTDDALLFTDSVNSTIGSTTLTNTGIKDVSVNMYTGGVIGADDTPYDWNYYIQDSSGRWIDGGSAGSSRFVEATVNENGMYTYNGEILENSYVYVIKDSNGYKVGVFLDDQGNIYRGNVYGKHNEILKTAVDENNKIYSFWGAENDDPNVLIANSNMTIGEFNRAMGALVTNVRNAQGDDIAKIKATQEGDGGTLSLMRRGTYNETTKTYTGDYAVEGSLKLTSEGGTGGNDVTLHIQQADATGTTYSEAFSLAAGSKVVALSGDDDTTTASAGDTLTKLQINGLEYNLAQDTDTTYTAADETITIDATNHTIKANSSNIINKAQTDIQNIVKGTEIHVKPDTKAVGDDGTVTFTYEDGTGNAVTGKGLKITGIAKNDLTNITNEGETVIKNLAGNAIDIKSADGNLGVTSNTENGVKTFTLTAKDTTLDVDGSTQTTETDGSITLTVKDTAGKTVTFDDLASHSDLSKLSGDVTTINSTVSTHTTDISTLKGQVITSGSIAADTGNVTLTTKGGTNINVGTVQDYSVTAGTYDSTNKKITLTKTNAYGGATDTVDIDLTALENKISQSGSELISKGFALEDKDGKKVTKSLGEAIKMVGENGINVKANNDDGQVTVSLDNNITIGTKGEDGKQGEQGHIGLAGKDGKDGIDGKDGNIVDIHIEKGKNGEKGADGKDGEMGEKGVDGTDGITRIVYTDAKGDHQVATMEDGLKFGGDTGDVIAKKLNNQLDIKGGATSDLTENNIGVISDDGVLKVKLANALNDITSITNGDTSITLNNGVTITGGTVNVSNNKITNVADGTADTDAVNKGQLDKVKKEISTLSDGAVMYDTKTDGKVDYDSVTMGGRKGTAYSRKEEEDDAGNVTVTYKGGTTITNVSYAEVAKRGDTGYDGSQAVNMDRLNDSIADAMSQVKTDVAGTEKHIKAGTYEIKDGKVTMQLVDGNEKETDETVVINDVAKASDIGSLNGGGHTTDGDGKLKDDLRNTEKNEDGSVKKDDDGNIVYKDTTVVDAINKVDDKVEKVSQEFNTYKSETNIQIEKINTSIKNITDDIDRRSTTVTVNGGNSTGNLTLVKKEEDEGKKVTFDISLSDTVTLGTGENTVTLDGTKGEASISKKLTVGTSEDGVTIAKTDLGTYSKDITNAKGEILHKKGDNLGAGHTIKGLDNTTIHTSTFATEGKAATEEQLKEALGDMDFDATIKNQAGETVNKYNIVNTATNVTEAVYQLDQSLTQANTRIDNNTINIQKLSGSLGKLNTRVNRVGAGAAALAALHPLDFDPDDKWDFAAGYGNYAGANATAIGAYYRPNEDTMLSIAGSFGGGENMVNAGVSFKLGRGNHVTTSKVAMAKEIKSLRATVEEQGKQIAALTALVEKLTGETVTTPEAPAPAETFTVDTVKEEDGQPVIERVRTVKGA